MTAKAKNNDDDWILLVIGVVGLILLFAFLTIPGGGPSNAVQIASLAFSNGVAVGWADNLASAILTDTQQAAQSHLKEYAQAITRGEVHYPIVVMVFTLLGTILSIGGVIAIAMARSASSAGSAFWTGFFAEIIEGVVYNIGYFRTTGRSGLSVEEIGVTAFVAVITGCIAVAVYSSAKK